MAIVRRNRFRPMGIGDILDETFDLYKNNFVLLVGVSAIVNLPLYFFTGFYLNWQNLVNVENSELSSSAAVYLIGILLALFGYVAVIGATTYAISRRYLDEPATIRQSYNFILRRIVRFLGMTYLSTLIIMIPLIAVGGVILFLALKTGAESNSPVLIASILSSLFLVVFPLSLFIATKLSFTSAAFVVEEARIGASIKRSWRLITGHGWRVFGVLLLSSFIVGMISGILTVPVAVISMLVFGDGGVGSAALISAGNAVVNTLLHPIPVIVLILLYYDVRVRKEGFDLQMLASDLGISVDTASNISSVDSLPPEI